jgi:hypothetical protein
VALQSHEPVVAVVGATLLVPLREQGARVVEVTENGLMVAELAALQTLAAGVVAEVVKQARIHAQDILEAPVLSFSNTQSLFLQ